MSHQTNKNDKIQTLESQVHMDVCCLSNKWAAEVPSLY